MTQPLPPPLSPEEREVAQRLARIGPHGEPSPAIDARILAAAHAATRGPRQVRSRWPMLLGMAASVVLALGTAWRLRPLPQAPAYRADASAPASRAPASPMQAPAESLAVGSADHAEAVADDAAAVDSAAPRSQAALPPRRAERPTPDDAEDVEPGSIATVAAPAAQPAAAPAPSLDTAAAKATAPEVANADTKPMAGASAAAVPPRDPSSATDVRRAAAAQADNAAAAAPTTADKAVPDEPLDDIPPATADSPVVRDAWLQRIRTLMDSGDSARARTSLHEFERRYPGYPVPDDLRALQR